MSNPPLHICRAIRSMTHGSQSTRRRYFTNQRLDMSHYADDDLYIPTWKIVTVAVVIAIVCVCCSPLTANMNP